jgi:alanine racemase
MRIGVVPVGTADGLARSSAADALVRGRRAPILEPISLEHCRLDLTEHPDAQPGDEVVLIGRQGDEEITLDEVVRHRRLPLAAHVPIEIRTSIPRRYVGGTA